MEEMAEIVFLLQLQAQAEAEALHMMLTDYLEVLAEAQDVRELLEVPQLHQDKEMLEQQALLVAQQAQEAAEAQEAQE
jgi:hypothetical protein